MKRSFALAAVALLALAGCGKEKAAQIDGSDIRKPTGGPVPVEYTLVHGTEFTAVVAGKLRARGGNPDKVCLQWVKRTVGTVARELLLVSGGKCPAHPKVNVQSDFQFLVGKGEQVAPREIVHPLSLESEPTKTVGHVTHFVTMGAVLNEIDEKPLGDIVARYKGAKGL